MGGSGRVKGGGGTGGVSSVISAAFLFNRVGMPNTEKADVSSRHSKKRPGDYSPKTA